MSLPFNDTIAYKGLVQFFEKEVGLTRGTVSGDIDLLKEFTSDVNISLDDFTAIALSASGKWQFDDSNHTDDYPIIYTSIVSGQRDYSFLSDAQGNLILDVYKVYILSSATATLYVEVNPIDQQSELTNIGIESTITGIPLSYDKTANAIIFDTIFNYNVAKGIKILINREGSYFTYTDTAKKPGVPGILHPYFYLKPAREYARRNSLASFARLDEEILKYEGDDERGIVGKITDYFSRRSKDDRTIMKGKKILYI